MNLRLFILFSFLFVISCAHRLVEDPQVNSAENGYFRVEFDTQDNISLKKEIGIGNISLLEGQSLEGPYFKIYGIGKGLLYLKSDACGINISTSFDKEIIFYLKDLIPIPTKCSIKVVYQSEKLDKKDHFIVEIGSVKINVLAKNIEPLTLTYSRANDFGKLNTYSFLGQGSLQRQEGDLTRNELVTVDTGISGGGQYRISGCGLDTFGVYLNSTFDFKFYDIYKKDFLKKEDTCDFEIIAIPYRSMYSKAARFSLVIYGKEVVKLEPLQYSIAGDKIKAKGEKYIIGCSINNDFKLSDTCSAEYNPDTVYWIRGFTLNSRKSIYAVKNGEIFWAE